MANGTSQEQDAKWDPAIVVALINQGGITLRWAGAGVGTFLLTAYFLPGCDCELAQSFERVLTYTIGFGVICIVFGISGFLYGRSQRAFRLQKTEQLAGRIGELERMIDPDRSSSGLQPTGETHPKDRL